MSKQTEHLQQLVHIVREFWSEICCIVLGKSPLTLKPGTMITESIEVETERVLENVGAILQAVKMKFTDVVSCRVYLTDMNDYGAMNEIYTRYFKEGLPARETVAVSSLPRGARVEISCVATL